MKKIVGVVEQIKIIGQESIQVFAVFDTGARSTSVDIKLASEAKLGPVLGTAKVRNPSIKKRTRRPVVKAEIEIKGIKFDTEVNIQDRSHMSFPIIIGRNILKGNFIVDAEINEELFKKKRKKHTS